MRAVPINEVLPNQRLPFINTGYVYDNNTLYVEMGGKSEEILKFVLDKLFIQLRGIDKVKYKDTEGKDRDAKGGDTKDRDTKGKQPYYINFIKPKDCAYVYIPNTEDLFRIAGCDKNGKIRVTETIVPSKHSEEEKKRELKKIEDIDDWGLHSQLMDEYNEKYLDKRVFTVDPIVTTPGFVFLRSEECDKSSDYVNKGYLVAMRARVRQIMDGLRPDVLRVSGIPTEFTVTQVRQIFGRYNTSEDKKYPIVEALDKCYKITYDKETTDGCFAQLMTGHFRIKSKDVVHNVYSKYWRK